MLKGFARVAVVIMLVTTLLILGAFPIAASEDRVSTTVSFSIKPAIRINTDGTVESNVPVKVIREPGSVTVIPL
jgi:hypothetical protein